MTVYSIGDKTPSIAPDAWVAPDASVIGDVQLAAKSSVWFGAAIRAENDHVVIGEGCNIQDGSVIHIDPGYPLTLHRHVTVGHKVMLVEVVAGNSSFYCRVALTNFIGVLVTNRLQLAIDSSAIVIT